MLTRGMKEKGQRDIRDMMGAIGPVIREGLQNEPQEAEGEWGDVDIMRLVEMSIKKVRDEMRSWMEGGFGKKRREAMWEKMTVWRAEVMDKMEGMGKQIKAEMRKSGELKQNMVGRLSNI